MSQAIESHLVWLSAVTWSFPLVGRTRMIEEEWQALGQSSSFIQIPSYRSALERLRAHRQPRESADVIRPWPSFPTATWTFLGESRVRRDIARRARQLRRDCKARFDMSSAVAIVVSPVWLPWLGELPFRAVIYDCIDDVAVMTPRPELLDLYQRWEAELIDRSDAAVASASGLADAIRERRPELAVTTIRNGVATEAFAASARRDPRPDDLPPASERICVGFVGALYDWIDWALIESVVERLPQFDFVFVGPHDGSGQIERIAERRNVYFLGPRPYDRVPAYIAAFDIGWVPFAAGKVSAHANPVKIYEYLALAKPVVSTPVADVDEFQGLVHVGRTPESISALLCKVAASDDDRSLDRIAFAKHNCWRNRALDYLEFITSVLH